MALLTKPLPFLTSMLAASWACAQDDPVPLFNRDIRPILADHCFACHGPDEATREADLRLDTREGATADLGGTRAIVPGNARRSELIKRVRTSDPDLRMPPPDHLQQLTPAQIDLLLRWIEAGAEYEGHWAFQPIEKLVPPAEATWSHPIDRFIAAGLSREGWSMAEEADKPTLIRRLTLALTGLPPSPADVEEFIADDRPNAYELLVDRLLQSPHYGEEMARHWLDLARYADTHGLHLDNERQTWAYRDWVIDSFNRNQPFDQFTIEQLAGDLLPQSEQSQLVATGFNRCNVTTSEGGAIDAEFQYRYAVDRTVTMAETWMGLTAGCAVCHDHKFDPLSQREFYSLYAFFNSAADPAMDGNALLTQPVLRLATSEHEIRLAAFDARIAALDAEWSARVAAYDYQDPAELDPPPQPLVLEQIWLDDAFPKEGNVNASPGDPTQFVSAGAGAPVFHGAQSLKRQAAGLAQDVWQTGQGGLTLPPQAAIFGHVWIDPENVPRSIMLQFFKNGWLHRAVWGDYEAIDWGARDTFERVHMGSLPPPGEWVRLEFDSTVVGLQPGDVITGFALTQFGGTVYWDQVGARGLVLPAEDPLYSLTAWWRDTARAKPKTLPEDIRSIAHAGPDAEFTSEEKQRLRRYYVQHVNAAARAQWNEIAGELQRVRDERQAYDQAIPRTFIYRDTPQPRDSFVMARGQYDQPGERVEPNVPACLPPLAIRDGRARADRLDLAQWLVSPAHPLTARVAVNRYWQQFFGVGLVESSGDFGTQGAYPTQPELLDWLAHHFRETGWDVKGLVRLLVTSRAFRQSSRATESMREFDPSNRWLARGPRFRLDAEQIRDQALYVSGLIQLEAGGKGVKPYQPANIWEPVGYVDSNTRFYRQDSGAALYRRSIYTFLKRTAPPPFMANFDAPNREQSCPRRERSNTPLQALQLMNDVQHVEAARFLAQRMMREGGDERDARLARGILIVLARDARPSELQILAEQLAFHRQRFAEAPDDARALIDFGESPADPGWAADELAAYTMVANTILNLDEALNRN